MACTTDRCEQTSIYDGSVTLGSISLPRDTVWKDFGNFDYFDAGKRYTLAGRLIICEAPKTNGRPITLEAEWVCLDTLNEVIASNQTGGVIQLLYSGITYDVCWDYASRPALNVTPVREMAFYEDCDDSRFTLTIKLIEV